MKKTLTLLASAFVFVTVAKSQNVPDAAKDAFHAKYPNVQDAHWEEDEGDFEAQFKEPNGQAVAIFDANGTWIATERRLGDDQIPESVLDKIKANYGKFSVMEAESVESASEGNYHELEVKVDGEVLDVKVFPNGKLMVEQDDEDDD